ncbi:MAG: N-acetylmuramoyl-L-alanine amidase [Acidobacteriota bacterium]|nr:N-acetylmuramoyl-L-alanine amidase [Bryobacteraceae bacterium CoA2 C42]
MRISVAIPVIAAAFLAPVCVAQTVLKDVRFWSQGEVTRVALELSEMPEFHENRLSQPDRVFFDFLDTKARIEGRVAATIAVNDAQLRQIRVGESRRGVTRMVLDLATDVVVTKETLSNPTRLILELRQPGTAAKTPAPAPAKAERSVWTPVVAVAEPPGRVDDPPELASPLPPILIALAPPRYPPFPVAARAQAPVIARTASAPPRRPSPAPAREAKPAAEAASTMTRTLGLKIRRIVLDPGHGGHDQGTSGPSGLTEKELVLDIALRLGQLLTDELGAEVIYTRRDDRFVALEERTRIANESRADLFLSIHANSSPIKTVSGIETFILSFTTQKDALETASRENASSELGVFELRDLLQKIALKEKVNESREFASRINAALSRGWYNQAANARNRGVKKAPFVVLIGANMPSVLAEIGFLSNARDEKELMKTESRQRMAEALAKGIAQYADSLSHFQVARGGAEE